MFYVQCIVVFIITYTCSILSVLNKQLDSLIDHLLEDAGITISLFEVHGDDVTTTLSRVGGSSAGHLPVILLCRTTIVVDILKYVSYKVNLGDDFLGDDILTSVSVIQSNRAIVNNSSLGAKIICFSVHITMYSLDGVQRFSLIGSQSACFPRVSEASENT